LLSAVQQVEDLALQQQAARQEEFLQQEVVRKVKEQALLELKAARLQVQELESALVLAKAQLQVAVSVQQKAKVQ
jgi:hypothetical protein